MIRDQRPYAVKRAYRRFEEFYVSRYIRPQLESLGEGYTFMKPWHVEVFGAPIHIGRCVNVIAAPDRKVRMSVWAQREGEGGITIGDYCLVCPGVRLGSAVDIRIGDNCMLANGAYVMDSDWHDLYNRIIPSKNASPVHIGNNAWIGDSAIVCKGVTIGENSVVGAGAVVVDDVPDNVVVAGNPARLVKRLDPDEKITTRAAWFANPEKLQRDIRRMDREMMKGNTFSSWLRHLLFPRRGD